MPHELTKLIGELRIKYVPESIVVKKKNYESFGASIRETQLKNESNQSGKMVREYEERDYSVFGRTVKD